MCTLFSTFKTQISPTEQGKQSSKSCAEIFATFGNRKEHVANSSFEAEKISHNEKHVHIHGTQERQLNHT